MKTKVVLMAMIVLAVAFASVMRLGLGADPPTKPSESSSERAKKAVASFHEQANKLDEKYARKLKALVEDQTNELDEASKEALKKGDIQEATELLSAKLMIQNLAAAKQERHAAGVPPFTCQTFVWKEDQPPTKMIHKDEGFCYLAGLNGGFVGGAESGLVYIGDDGYWYLKGLTNQRFLRLHAVAVKLQR